MRLHDIERYAWNIRRRVYGDIARWVIVYPGVYWYALGRQVPSGGKPGTRGKHRSACHHERRVIMEA